MDGEYQLVAPSCEGQTLVPAGEGSWFGSLIGRPSEPIPLPRSAS